MLPLLMLVSCATLASAANITGLIKDAVTGETLPEASVKLLSLPDSAFVKGVTSNTEGRFALRGIKSGKYVAVISYIGYKDIKKDVAVGSSNIRLGVLEMREATELLGELVVTATKTPIKVMEDTVEYNADSYHTQPNAVVEDLLKRLPGVEVGTDGSITANGKTVTKFLVNGKEFFSDDPKVASKNLPAEMVDKLQVVDRKSDMARLTGVDDGEDETVINLTFKKNMNQGWFGTIEGGYGTDHRYMGSFNVNRFWDGNQVTLLGNFNNTNQIGFTDSNGNRFRRFGGNNGITESRALGLNFNVGNKEIIRVGGDIMWSNTDALTIKRQRRENLFEGYSTWSDIDQRTRDRGNNFRGDFRVLWNPDSFNTLEFRPNFSVNFNKSEDNEVTAYYNRNHDKASDNNAIDRSHGKSYEVGGRLIYSHKFKQRRGRSFSVSGQYNFSNVIEKGVSLNDFISYLLEEDPDNNKDTDELLHQFNDNHTWSNRVMGQLTWTEPLGDVAKGNFITFSYRGNYKWNNADKLVYDLPDDYTLPSPLDWDFPGLPGEGAEYDPDYSNRYRNDAFTQNIRLGYRKVTSASNLEVGVSAVPQMTKSVYLDNADKNIDRWVWNYAPFLRYRYKFSKRSSIQLHYNGRSSQPSLKQLQPVLDISNPTNKVQGNPNLDPTFNHSLMVRFQDFNTESQRSIMLMANFQYSQNAIISKVMYNEDGTRLTTYENVNGVWNGRVMNMFSMPLRNKKWTVSNHIFANASRSVGYNNGVQNAALNIGFTESPSIAFRPDNFEFEIRPRYSLQSTHNTVQSKANQLVHTYGGSAYATYYTSWGLTLQSDVRYSATQGYAQGFDTKTWIWNASISQQFLRDRSLTLAVKVYDILNQRNSIRRNVSANYIDDTSYNSLTRYGMLTLSWRFNSFGKGNTPSVPGGHGGFRGGPHGGPGMGRGPR